MREFSISCEKKTESKIVCCNDALKRAAALGFNCMVFTDENVLALYEGAIRAAFPCSPVFAMKAGEEHKTEETLFELLKRMAEAGLHRGDCLVCVGGGVVGDIGGLASALYMRGLRCVQIPTTLLSQVDSSVGGKTAVDFMGYKNLVGAFKQPDYVLVDGSFFKTLPARDIRCGLGEIVKHAALDGALFQKLKANRDRLSDLDFLTQTVPDNIAIKAEIVQKDPEETGLRKCLNLGHTTAHAFELSDKKLSHGEYVLIGTLYEAEIAKRRLPCDEKYLNELKELALAALGGVPSLPSAEAVAPLAKLDKKNRSDDRIALTVPVSEGRYAFCELPYAEYVKELKEIRLC